MKIGGYCFRHVRATNKKQYIFKRIMNVTLEKTGDVSAKIVVNVEAADYTDKVKSELKKISATHVIPGFRKGHVPMPQLRQRFGKGVKSDVINDMVYREVLKYIQENKIHILGEPMPVEIQEIGLDDKDYTFEYEVGLCPELPLKLDKETSLPYYTIEVTDTMREEQDKAMRERLGAQVPGEEVEEKALVKGAIMELNEDGTVKTTEDAIQVINGIVAPFYFKSKEEADKFNGKKINDKVVFNPWKSCEGNVAELSSMLNIDKEKAGDVKADFELAISEIIVLRPAEHNQEYFDNVFGKDKVHNEEEYTTALTEMIANALKGNSEQLFATQAREYFTKACEGVELPVEFLKKWLVARNKELTQENIDAEFEKMKPSLIWELVKGEMSEKLGVKVEEADLLEFAKSLAYQQFAQYGITNLDDDTITDHAKRILSNQEYRQRIADNVADAKIFTTLQGVITLDEKTVSLDEFKEIAQKA